MESNVLDLDEKRLDANYAGFWWRVLAAVIDGFLLGIVSFILGLIFGESISFFQVKYIDGEMRYATGSVLVALIQIALPWLYFALMESSEYQGTVGKRALGLKVTDLNGERISFARATGRYFAKYISQLILLIGYIMVAFTEKKQGLHDMIAGTLVIKKPEGSY